MFQTRQVLTIIWFLIVFHCFLFFLSKQMRILDIVVESAKINFDVYLNWISINAKLSVLEIYLTGLEFTSFVQIADHQPREMCLVGQTESKRYTKEQ